MKNYKIFPSKEKSKKNYLTAEEKEKRETIANKYIIAIGYLMLVVAIVIPFILLPQAKKSQLKLQDKVHYEATGRHLPKHPRSNRSDYITNVYVLKPKNKAYFYSGKNTVSQGKEVSTIIIPTKVSVGRTVYDDESLFTRNSHAGDPFLENTGRARDTNIDFPNNITLNSNHAYPLDQNSSFIKVIAVKQLYQYVIYFFSNRYYFVAPIKSNDRVDPEDSFSSQHTYYLSLNEFTLSYQKKYNVSRSKDQICIGFIEKK